MAGSPPPGYIPIEIHGPPPPDPDVDLVRWRVARARASRGVTRQAPPAARPDPPPGSPAEALLRERLARVGLAPAPWYTTPQVAAVAGVGRGAAGTWCADGRLAATRDGGEYHVPHRELVRMIEHGRLSP